MRAVAAALLLLTACALAACAAPGWKRLPHDRPFQQVEPPKLHPIPATDIEPSDWWDTVLHSSVVPAARLVSPARWIEVASGGRPALDVNAFGKVPDSSWFENRIGERPLAPEQVRRGPRTGEPSGGPAPGPLTVVSGKLEGATPGLVARDSRGTIWFVKFDPPAFRGLSTGAEAIAARLYWAAGYHVPETHVVELDVDRLVLAEDAFRRDDYNRRVPMEEADLRALLINLNPGPKNELRALMSRSVPGQPIGPFSYRGVRTDDPNDVIPHERRRSLRGLWLFSAWLNNTDTRRQNTLDTFITPPGSDLGFLRHYLIDFGDALGAAGDRVKYLGEGYEEQADWSEMLRRILAVGLQYPYWLDIQRSPYRSVGVFEARIFDPARWTPVYPNPAFEEATPRDSFWAGSILARIKKEHVAAAVEAADYRNEEAAAYVLRVLLARRERVLAYAFFRMAPLDDPEVRAGYRVHMIDLERLAELPFSGGSYHFRVRWNRTGADNVELESGVVAEPAVDLRSAVRRAILEHGRAFQDDPFLTLSMWKPRYGRRGARVDVHLRAAGRQLIPVGIWREVE